MTYLDLVCALNELHRLSYRLLRDTLREVVPENLNPTQILILYTLSDQRMTVGALNEAGCFVNSNIGYNLKLLSDAGYIYQSRVDHDRRRTMISVTPLGREIRARVVRRFATEPGISLLELARVAATLQQVETALSLVNATAAN